MWLLELLIKVWKSAVETMICIVHPRERHVSGPGDRGPNGFNGHHLITRKNWITPGSSRHVIRIVNLSLNARGSEVGSRVQ